MSGSHGRWKGGRKGRREGGRKEGREKGKVEHKEKQMHQMVFQTNNKITLKGKEKKNLAQGISEYIWTIYPQAKGKKELK